MYPQIYIKCAFVLNARFSDLLGFPGGSAGKESSCNAGDLGLIPGLGRSPGEENSYPHQYSGLENSMGLKKLDKTEQLSLFFTFLSYTFLFLNCL